MNAALTQMAPFQAKEQEATQKAAAIANQPAPPPPPHARLMNMIAGLGAGLSSMGTALATHGREGGAPQAQATLEARQQQEIQARQATMAQKNQQIQQQLTVADTNHKLAQNILLLATTKQEMEQRDVTISKEKQGLQAGEQGLQEGAQRIEAGSLAHQNERNDFISKWGYAPDVTSPSQVPASTGAAGTADGAAPNGASTPPGAIEFQNRYIDFAASVLPGGDKNPAVVAANAALDKAQRTGNTDAAVGATAGLRQAVALNAQSIDQRLKQQTEAKGEQEVAQAKLKTEQDQLAQNTFNRTVGRNASGQPTEDFATWQARTTKLAEVQAQQGDPSALGAMAADGLLTIPQIAIARQLDKKAFQELIAGADAEAKKNGAPEVVVNGRPTGHYFNAQAATQQYQYVQEFNNPNNKSQQAIGAGNTFLEHSADLLDVNNEYRRANNLAFLNTPLNKIEKNFGSTAYTKFVNSLAPVQTEYDNALKAGFAPTAEDAKSVSKLLDPAATPAQIEEGVKVMGHTILRRMDTTNQGFKTHTGVDYPNMITPDAKEAISKMGPETQAVASGLQSGGTFSGPRQVVNAGAPAATAAPKASSFTRPPTVSPSATLMQVPGGQPHLD